MNIKKCSILGFFFVLILGIFMHYAYGLSGNCRLLSYFAPVNESPWEHLKLIFWPSILFCVYEYFVYGKSRRDFFAVKMTSITAAMLFIITFFYTYSGVLGFNIMLFDILDFVMADALCFYISYYMITSCNIGTVSDSVESICVLVILGICFIIWTNNPPDLGIFWG